MNKKLIILALLLVVGSGAANAQFGKLKGLVGGGKAGKKAGNFKTVWEA